MCLVADGQLPLRQCMHPESCAKDIPPLPSYYWKFSDLKKEHLYSKSGDLSRAITPNMPAASSAQTIADIMNGEFFFTKSSISNE
jgi:hypothetical protein